MNTYKTILIVEDSPVQGAAIGTLLMQGGFSVLWAKDGQEGVIQAKIHLPDAIVMDIEMPSMNGFEACRHLKANFTTRQIPIIMLTSQDNLAHLEQGLDAGASDFIPKDVLSGSVLLNTLASLMSSTELVMG
jgi:CheY-like chemotaxis protein